ncbi:hypothetical protein JG687_00010242 [Phytophthora cactorum]|uniref:AB hydrolase-1 domain-containing protein n=1 Tax=Phytophthora cactorum TaxID=29920 RepID=A0A8T1U9J7_9STRA|nr:hypothetical protein JG687_00010242 [Phytophthora cactorum]
MGNVFTRALAWNHQPRFRLAFVLVLLYLAKKLLGPSLMAMLIRWHFARAGETPRLIYRKTPANKKLLSHCVTMTQTKYYPPWNLFNGHLQTITFAKDKRGPKIKYKRQLLDMPDGGVVSLDWALLPGHSLRSKESDGTGSSWIEGVDPTRRTVLLLPGLTGGSPANYIRFTVAKLHEIGWQCVVLNARGCANTPVRTAQLYCTAYTEDLRFVLQQLDKKYGFCQEAFVGVGFSMGSNVLVKYLGEEGEQTPLTGAVSVGNPFNLIKVSENLSGTWFNRLMYDKALNRSMKSLFFEKSNAAEKFEGYPGLDMEAVRASRTVREFDDTLTSVLFSYKNADHFYEDASSDKKLRAVKVPLLCINAEDDPISSGGHLAYYESSRREKEGPTMWTAKPIAEFAEAVRYHREDDEVLFSFEKPFYHVTALQAMQHTWNNELTMQSYRRPVDVASQSMTVFQLINDDTYVFRRRMRFRDKVVTTHYLRFRLKTNSGYAIGHYFNAACSELDQEYCVVRISGRMKVDANEVAASKAATDIIFGLLRWENLNIGPVFTFTAS